MSSDNGKPSKDYVAAIQQVAALFGICLSKNRVYSLDNPEESKNVSHQDPAELDPKTKA